VICIGLFVEGMNRSLNEGRNSGVIDAEERPLLVEGRASVMEDNRVSVVVDV